MPTKRLVALDVRPSAVKLAEVLSGDGDCRVLSYSIDYFENADSVEHLYETVKASLQKNKVRSRDAVAALSGEDVSFALIDLPQLPEKELDEAIEHKIENLASVAGDQLVIDYYPIARVEGSDKRFYFCAYITKEYSGKIASALQRAGLKIKVLVPSVCALSGQYPQQEKDPVCLINLGKFSSLILLMKAGKAVFAREVKVGSDTIAHSMTGTVVAGSERIDLDLNRAEEVKNKFGIPMDFDSYTKASGLQASEIMAMMRPALEKIGAEILRTFEYYRQETGDTAEFAKVFVTGGGSRLTGLAQYLSEELGIEVKEMAVKASAKEPALKESLPHLSLAVGAALLDRCRLELLPFELRFPFISALQRSVNIYSVSAVYGLTLLLLYCWLNFIVVPSAQKEHKALEAAYKSLSVETSGQELSSDMERLISSFSDKRKGERFAVVMKELYALTPKGIYFRSLDYSNPSDRLIIRGVIVEGRTSGISKFVKELKKGKIFKSVDISYMQSSTEFTVPTVDFEIHCDLKEQI